MQDDYYKKADNAKVDAETAADRLRFIERLVSTSVSRLPPEKHPGRNLWTRILDSFFALVRDHVPPLHWLGAGTSAFIIFSYARLVALTIRLITTGYFRWPNMPAGCVLALWHSDAPSLLIAFAARRPSVDLAILVAPDARGDFVALICRMLGLNVVRGGSDEGGWQALIDLAQKIELGASVIITTDGGGPAHVVKVGAIALASATRVPLVPLSAYCHPAIVERRKWDAARNPVPFAKIAVAMGEPFKIEPLDTFEMIEKNRQSLQLTLEELGVKPRQILGTNA
jgi:lysophospholipid acyltransferase (LPLAT)-like uncharacterized protein